VDRGRRSLRFGVRTHGDKRETARAAREFVHGHEYFLDIAVSGKDVAQLAFASVEVEISDV
jgi:6-pyruvoyl-tetrahydropterin synthase